MRICMFNSKPKRMMKILCRLPKLPRIHIRSLSLKVENEWVRNQNGELFFIARQNDKFENYFRQQKLCDSEEEWQECLSYMRRDLPQSFRINSNRSENTIQKLEDYLSKFPDLVERKPWNSYVWQVKKHSRWDLRTDPKLKDLRAFLLHQRQCGNISRQELVSMIPVFLLDIEPHHRVLDMCASPGSKTKHVLEIMQAKYQEKRGPKDSLIPSGFVVTNEFDVSRCDKLINNVKYFSSPCSIHVNHDGQNFPDFRVNPER